MSSIPNSAPVTHCDCGCGAPIPIEQLESVTIHDGYVFFNENHFWDWIAKRDPSDPEHAGNGQGDVDVAFVS